MNEGRIARLFGLTLGGLLAAGLVLNALAGVLCQYPSKVRYAASSARPDTSKFENRRLPSYDSAILAHRRAQAALRNSRARRRTPD